MRSLLALSNLPGNKNVEGQPTIAVKNNKRPSLV